MALTDTNRNIYEGTPEQWKDLPNYEREEQGELLKKLSSRKTLLKCHEQHLQLLESPMPPRTLILPPPYLPSRVSIARGEALQLKDLKIANRRPDKYIVLRTITESYVYSSSVTIAEDEAGATARLTVCNLEDSPIDPIITLDSFLVVKQPCWNRTIDDGYHIRVDHPSDLVILDQKSELIPKAWRIETATHDSGTYASWKKEGDMMFLKKKFRKALELYDRSLSDLDAESDPAARIDLYRKRCGVNLVLLRFDDAAKDLSRAISLYAASKGNELQHLADSGVIETWLHNRSHEDPLEISNSLTRPLKDLATRIKVDVGMYQNQPDYDLQTMASCVGPLSLHVDASNYTSDTDIKLTPQHGRGMFAKRALKTGDLIIAEKAFALPGYFFNDRGSECSLYSLGDGTATDRAGAHLFKELVQKLKHSPSLRREYFDLDDGGYWKENGVVVEEGEEIPVDVFRVEIIRRRNCFSVPLRSLDLLTAPAAVRNGFWVHSSYVNHGCLPNSVRTFIGDILLLRASRDIAEGEEILSQYVSPELKYEDRQRGFRGTWGFTCDCGLCTFDKNIGAELEGKRMAIFEELKGMAQKLGKTPTVTALKKFARRIRDLEALYDAEIAAESPCLCLVHPTLFLTEAWRALKHGDRMIESATKLLRYFGIVTRIQGGEFEVLKNSGLVNVETVRALKYMTEGYEAKGQASLASQIDSLARLWFKVITGADVGVNEFFKA